MKKLNLIILLLCFIHITSFAITWNVSTSGNDNNTGTIEAPFATIQKGIDTATNGDTVLIQQGAYIENINFNGKNIVVASQFISTNDTSYISSTIIDGNQSGSVVTFNNNEDSTCCLIGLTLKNGNSGRGGGIHCSSSSPCLNNLIIDNCTAFEWGGGIYISGGSPLLDSITLINNSTDVIHIRGSNPSLVNIEISNNLGNYGIAIIGGANPKMDRIIITHNNFSNTILINGSSPIISNLLIDNNTSGDIFLLTNPCDAELNFATIYDNTVSNILKTHESNSNLTVKNSIIWNNSNKNNSIYPGTLSMTYSNDEVGTSGTGNINTNPMFIDAEIGDYHLSNYSPCIGAGSLNDTISIDLDGLARPNPNGTTPDIGAYENELSSGLHNSSIYVDTTGNDKYGNGLPSAPFQNIQTAINYAEDGDTVLVHTGTYVENINFNGKNIVVASNFIYSRDTADISNTIIDGGGYSAYSESVARIINGESDEAQLIGFTIQNGNALNTQDRQGGGIRIENSDPIIKHCLIKDNVCYYSGGGISLKNSGAKIFHSRIINNVSSDGAGGGINIHLSDKVIISSCIIENNYCGAIGSGIGVTVTDTVIIINSVIANNTGGQSELRDNAGIYLIASHGIFINNTIANHEIGIILGAGSGNSFKADIINTIFRNNNDILFSEVYLASPTNLFNCIIDTTAFLYYDQGTIVEDLVGVLLNYNNIICEDPQFLDEENLNFRLSNFSPGIGSGLTPSPFATIPIPEYDLVGYDRPNPTGSIPDIGAYENTLGTPKMLFDSTICLKDTLKVVYNGVISGNIKLSWNFTGASFVDTTDIRNARVLWDEAGYKTISLLVKDNGVTLDNQIDSVLVYNIPTATFVTDAQKLCGSDTVLVSYTGTGSPNASYNWNFNSGNIISGSGQGDYQVNWLTSGLKTISLSVEENGCTSETSSKELNVYQIPTSQFSLQTDVCDTNHVIVSYLGNASDTANYLWDFDNGNIISGSGQGDYEINWNSIGEKSVNLLVEENGCYSDSTINIISINEIPTSTFSFDTQKLCGLDTVLVSYTGTGSPNASYNWNFNSGNIISGSGQGDYQINWNAPGLKNISLSVTENGCTSSLTSDIVSVYQPTSTFFLNDVVCENMNTTINFTGYASDSATFNWDFNSANILSGSVDGPYVLNWDNFGTKNVTLSIDDNGCLSSTTTNSIEHNPMPTSTITAPSNICFNGSANISYIGTASNTANFDWSFDNGSIISGTGAGPYEISWNDAGLKTISLNVTENGCSSDTSINLTVNQQTQPISICMVSVDSSNHNMVVWEQPTNNPYYSIIIYKETSQSNIYERIGSQSASDITVFIDSLSNPAQNSSRYKIAVLDTCGFETAQSDYHKTMHLTINLGIGGAWNLIWDGYEGFDYSTYNIYRGTSDNNLLRIAEQASNTFTYTDLTPPVGTVFYQIEVVNPHSCNVSNLKSTNNYYGSTHSNIVNSNQATSINNISLENIEIWPNPADNKLFIKSDMIKENFTISILTLYGKVLMNKRNSILNTEIDISTLNKGMYILRLNNDNKPIYMKLIKL